MKPEVTTIESLSEADHLAMFDLLDRCFSGVTRETFAVDLANKTLAVLLRDTDETLQGFSTLALYPATGPDQGPATIACSGDTIVAPEAWGASTLPRAWINAALRWHEHQGQGPLYWLLITSGFRTYRFLPVFFEQFYPHYAIPTPPQIESWMHSLAEQRWSEAYDRASGIVRFDRPQQLRGSLAEIPDAKRQDPHVQYFLGLNPGHANGDELVSVCELSRNNLTRAGNRMLEAGAERSRDPMAEVIR